MAKRSNLPEWLSRTIHDKASRCAPDWFGMTPGTLSLEVTAEDVRTPMAQTIKLSYGNKFLIANGSCQIAAYLSNVETALQEYSKKSSKSMAFLANGTIISLRKFSIELKRNGLGFEVFLDVKEFRIVLPSLPSTTTPLPFQKSALFLEMEKHAKGEQSLTKESHDEPLVVSASQAKPEPEKNEKESDESKSSRMLTPVSDKADYHRPSFQTQVDGQRHADATAGNFNQKQQDSENMATGKDLVVKTTTPKKADIDKAKTRSNQRPPLQEIQNNVQTRFKTLSDFDVSSSCYRAI
jgi:hypothetical protein